MAKASMKDVADVADVDAPVEEQEQELAQEQPEPAPEQPEPAGPSTADLLALIAQLQQQLAAAQQPEASAEPAVPGSADAPLPGNPEEGYEGGEVYHLVAPADSWETLAEQYSTHVAALYALNAAEPHFSERGVTVNSTIRVR